MLSRCPWLHSGRWFYLIGDEAQAIKNPSTRQTKAVKALPGQHRAVMTGTPVENRLSDLWSLFDFINTGLLGSFTEFKAFSKRLAVNPDGYGRWFMKTYGLGLLESLCSPCNRSRKTYRAKKAQDSLLKKGARLEPVIAAGRDIAKPGGGKPGPKTWSAMPIIPIGFPGGGPISAAAQRTLTADEKELSELIGIEMESPESTKILIPSPKGKAAETQKKPKTKPKEKVAKGKTAGKAKAAKKSIKKPIKKPAAPKTAKPAGKQRKQSRKRGVS